MTNSPEESQRDFKITSGLQEGQVLQRLKSGLAKIDLRGCCPADGPMRITICKSGKSLPGWNRRMLGRVHQGKFAIKVGGIPAGGPYELRLEAEKLKTVIRKCFVGDVWILAGQSNMEGAGKLPGRIGPHPLVRAFSQRREWRLATDPLHLNVESPDACHNDGHQISSVLADSCRLRASQGAGVGVPFGREMLKRSGVPQGLICVSRGGSPLSLWDPKDPAQLYASMMASVHATGQPVAGVLWYQGESDTSAEQAAVYSEKTKALVAAVRLDLKQPRLPWIMVQLARVFREGSGMFWNSVQEQQRLLYSVVPALECVAAIDLSLNDEIHLDAESFAKLANRLARAADRLVCGNRKEKFPPRLSYVRRSVSTETNPGPKCGIDVGFEGLKGCLQAEGEPSGFYLVDQEGKEIPWIFKTTLHDDYVRLHIMRQPPQGTRVAYGIGFAPRCNITDSRGMALPVFAPQEIDPQGEMLPFVLNWRVSPVIDLPQPIERLKSSDAKEWREGEKTYESGFINEHDAWQGKGGYAFFASGIEIKAQQSLEFLMGYDGPFRLWLDGKPFFCDPRGCNPCIADQSGKTVRLSAGKHEILVAMDINCGRAWGFFLRFRRAGGHFSTFHIF